MPCKNSQGTPCSGEGTASEDQPKYRRELIYTSRSGRSLSPPTPAMLSKLTTAIVLVVLSVHTALAAVPLYGQCGVSTRTFFTFSAFLTSSPRVLDTVGRPPVSAEAHA